MAKQPDTDTKAQAIIYAEVYGDDAACRRYKVSLRTLQRYRELARDETSELSQVVARYAAALAPEAVKVTSFADWLAAEVRRTNEAFFEKLKEATGRNPETLRAITEHMGRLVDRDVAREYMDRLFTPDEPGDSIPDEAAAADEPAWSGSAGPRPQAFA